jgi:hypothetical protein
MLSLWGIEFCENFLPLNSKSVNLRLYKINGCDSVQKSTLLFIESIFAAHDSLVLKTALGSRPEISIHYHGSDLAFFDIILTSNKLGN